MPTAQLVARPSCSGDTPPRKFGANPTSSSGNGTSADDNRMQVDSLKKSKRKGKCKNQHQRGNRTTNTSSTDIDTCKNCVKPGHWTKSCWNLGGGAYDNSTNRNTGKSKSGKHVKGKTKMWTLSKQNNLSLLKQAQPCRIVRKIRVVFKRGPVDHGWPSICFLTVEHRYTPVHARIPVKRYRCLILESTQWSKTPTRRKTTGDIQT